MRNLCVVRMWSGYTNYNIPKAKHWIQWQTGYTFMYIHLSMHTMIHICVHTSNSDWSPIQLLWSSKWKYRRLCVLSNTKLYHRNLLFWISAKFGFLDGKKHFSPQFRAILNIIKFVAPLWNCLSKDPPICPNSYEKLTKSEISYLIQFSLDTYIYHYLPIFGCI